MTFPDPDLTPVLAVTPWADPVIDVVGHDPRSPYVETFWLGILGPSATWLLRRLATEFDRHPDGFDMHLRQTALILGLGSRNGKHSPFLRSVQRCCQFGLCVRSGPAGLAVRRRLPPLTRAQVLRLPRPLQSAHEDWTRGLIDAADVHEQRRRARRVALSMVDLGEDPEAVERRLHRWRFHPAVAHDAARWAVAQHAMAAGDPPPPPRPPVRVPTASSHAGDAA